jgi:adenylylsulfate kinase-like enzyme
MSHLRQVLQVIHDAHEQVHSLEAEVRNWVRPQPSNELLVDPSPGGGALRWAGAGPWPQPEKSVSRIWRTDPDHIRVEREVDGMLVHVGVRAGTTWWRWRSDTGTTVGRVEPGPGAPGLPPMLDPPMLTPARLISNLRFESVAIADRGDRKVLTARALSRAPEASSDSWYDLVFDAEHGTLLRIASFSNGACYRLSEVLRISYDPEISPQRFAFTPPDPLPETRLQSGRAEDAPTVTSQPSQARREISGGACATLWLTGPPMSGKTTLARVAEQELRRIARPSCVLDEGELRDGLNSDLGVSRRDLQEGIRRAAQTAALLVQANVVAIVAFDSGFVDDRIEARRLHERVGLSFFEVLIDTPEQICKERATEAQSPTDYDRCLNESSGVTSRYEYPEAPDLTVPGFGESPLMMARQIVALLESKKGPGAQLRTVVVT